MFKRFVRRYPRQLILFFFAGLIFYWFSLPKDLFNTPTSFVLEDKDGNLLGAKIAKDGLWRFPAQQAVPEKFEQAIIEFEDRRFHKHLGVDPVGIGRAIQQNFRNKKIVSGGSTISMQVIRMARGQKRRNVGNKIIEALLATRLELKYSKKEILALYASNAPFGGNVVGLDAASWRYYGKNPELLSWSEAATLAVLPNSPALIHPGRNRSELLNKRNRLLSRLQEKAVLDTLSAELAMEEPLPEKPLPLPRHAPHLLERAAKDLAKNPKNSTRVQSTLDIYLQQQSNVIVNRNLQRLKNNDIHNLAILIMDTETGNVLAYVGNSNDLSSDEHGHEVDVITAPRSTGSILKPFLYALKLHDGEILPPSLIPDIPTYLSGYRPKNFHKSYDGAVPAQKAISRSLNVPSVRMLQEYGLEKFHHNLKRMGLSHLNQASGHYGLTLVLGGAEASLWDLCGIYASMGRTLNHVYDFNGRYDPHDFRGANYLNTYEAPKTAPKKLLKDAPILSAAACWTCFESMQKVERPSSEGSWELYQSSKRIAWKTGTSYGFRDAWAIGLTPKYTVGVWAGNADGEGRKGLVGVKAAAPVLFDLFQILHSPNWFDQPYDEMSQIPVCAMSGYRSLNVCETVDTIWAPTSGLNAPSCPYHRTVHLDPSETWQVSSRCMNPSDMVHKSWFVLPPIEEQYYKSKNPAYKLMPPFREDCIPKESSENLSAMAFIYPKRPTQIYLAIDLDGKPGKTVFKIAHRAPENKVFWHLDNEFIGETQHFHEIELGPKPGKHIITVVDENGFQIQQRFEIISK